ncbi:MAG TPA: DUF302 domain-containing protein [Polyangiaceae bacterium]|jgi:uncharacterized protein (DUF302 family)|nr:DUF302 domain-containing protein [Polyangiaceae bacterium]
MSNTDVNEQPHRGTWQALGVSFEAATERLPQALQAEGFGVITQIDLQQTFKAKLGADFRRYRIFGACNPAYALKAVELDPRAGLLLPCNVVLFERDDGVVMLGTIDPVQQLNAPSGPLAELASEIGARLTRVAQSFGSSAPSGGVG